MAHISVFPSQRLLLQYTTCSKKICSAALAHSLPSLHKLQSAREASRLRAVVTDETVPEGHKGLHGFLYGEQGAEVHEDGQEYAVREGEDEGKVLMPVDVYLDSRYGQTVAGVYAIHDDLGQLQYIGFARSITAAIKAHLARVGGEKCNAVRTKVFHTRAVASRSALSAKAEEWLQAVGTLPPGNSVDQDLWEGGRKKANGTDAEAYEEKKLKMRKAMGENLHDATKEADPDAEQRRLNLMKAVGGDDWSAVIDAQTQETIETRPDAEASTSEPMVSPFAQRSVRDSLGQGGASTMEMTVETVDKILDDVRPYLIADGGNVEVAKVADGVVSLRLQGACGTCASSSATMKMGLERALKEAFGGALKEVKQVDAIDISASVSAVDAHLDMLRPAIKSYGGSVTVVSVQGGVCKVKYDGPPPIAMGIKAAIRDKFPDITTVEMVA